MPANANYWVPFLVAGMRLLKPGGSLAYILPAAWEYANYAVAVLAVFGAFVLHFAWRARRRRRQAAWLEEAA